ncbi:N-acetyl-alpha-D-glucosaminyl L-malate synthase BshA [Paenibacillus agricola]|uniref:N-acetyl-alpha-D-glucosaminyl L-malate synthase BshA n=1 Tax=Paenibacillus agricola TaxID=2716264 RepID=A0ABX0J3J5_9BACL|nr:N-acetyl-alpha-D-glucosaminyl L-malate synthase BshA [Paenibacillus agricola]NHN28691.1 N-acetyl-alpha-D-glucosaminyl L-malate synthase BshA [Paenibacillus agricola]
MKERLKIGITCYPTLGGSGVVATELGKLLAEKGHEVHFITHSMPFRLGKFDRNIFYHEVEVNDYYVFKYPPYDLSLASKLAQVVQLEELDLLHVHYAIPHAVCALLAKQMVGDKLKVVTTLHGTDITVLAQDESLSDLIRYAINQSDAVTAVSKDLIEETRRLLNIEKHIDLAYNFVDKRVYFPREVTDLRKEFAQPDEKILIHISNFRPVKRVTDVVEIFHRVAQEIPCRLLFVGEGPELSKVLCRVKELGLLDRVTFCGKQDDVAQLLSLSDVMLLPSEKESFGLVALEAMACGVPTVASNTGGIPELIVHGESGFLADIGDVEQMAHYTKQLLTDKPLYEKIVEACLYRARFTFCNDVITRQYEEIYYRVLGLPIPDELKLKPLNC